MLTLLEFSFVPIIYFFYPETSNISLEDIDRIFVKDGDESDRSSTIAGDDEERHKARAEEREGADEKTIVERV